MYNVYLIFGQILKKDDLTFQYTNFDLENTDII